jgi:Cdc6-like AAA superfamily ATPase
MANRDALAMAVNALYPLEYGEGVDAGATIRMDTDNPVPSRPTYMFTAESDNATLPPWVPDLTERFRSTIENGILYRPRIVEDLRKQIDRLFKSLIKVGLMVKGPQGVGKSHTLVNLVVNLEEQRDKGRSPYHVTFIPNCDNWRTVGDFVWAVLDSFEVSAVISAATVESVQTPGDVHMFVDLLDDMLKGKKIKWIFIFDQVNALFGRKENHDIRDVHKLPFPYYLISSVRKPRRILSIICASTNNEISHRDRHSSFQDYIHPIRFDEQEARQLYEIADVEALKEQTGLVPLQVARFVELGIDYTREERDSIHESVLKLTDQLMKRPQHWPIFIEGVVRSLLKTQTTAIIYDRKYFIDSPTQNSHKYEPLYPLVEEVYMTQFWDDVMQFVHDNEQSLLTVCANPSVDQGSRGRHFELIVIQRCLRGPFTIPGEITPISNHLRRFEGNGLPEDYGPNDTAGLLVPCATNFKAIDMVWKIGTRVIGVQVHISTHKDTVTAFEGLCRQAEWHKRFNTIEMWFLCPTEEAKKLVARFAGTHTCRTTRSNSNEAWTIEVSAKTIGDISCLSNLTWPTYRQ